MRPPALRILSDLLLMWQRCAKRCQEHVGIGEVHVHVYSSLFHFAAGSKLGISSCTHNRYRLYIYIKIF